MRYKAVVFDLDGTLLDTLADLAAAGNAALEACGFPTHPADAFRRFVGDGRHNMVLRMLPAHAAKDEETVRRAEALFSEYYAAHMADMTAPYPGVAELAAALKKEGVRLAILSNKPEEFVRPLAEQYFPGIFDLVCGQKAGLLKPDPTGLLQAMEGLGVKPGETLYVGDSAVDVQTAHNAGCFCCGVTWGFRDKAELRRAGADKTADTPLELMAIALPEERTTSKGMRLFSLFVAAVMIICLLGVIFSMATGNMAGLSAGFIFPIVLGVSALYLLRRR